jgi:HEPN domain-containing protein
VGQASDLHYIRRRPQGGIIPLRPRDRAAAQRWLEIARERGTDAIRLRDSGRTLAALYFEGYVVEAYAKAYACCLGKQPRLSHNLILLLEDCGLRRSDLPVDLRAYADERTVEMRYQPTLSPNTNFSVEFDRAQRLAGFLSVRINRHLR